MFSTTKLDGKIQLKKQDFLEKWMGGITEKKDLKTVADNLTELKIDKSTQFKVHCEYQAGKR